MIPLTDVDIHKMYFIQNLRTILHRLWNRIPRGCFPDYFKLNLLKFRVNHHLLWIISFRLYVAWTTRKEIRADNHYGYTHNFIKNISPEKKNLQQNFIRFICWIFWTLLNLDKKRTRKSKSQKIKKSVYNTYDFVLEKRRW